MGNPDGAKALEFGPNAYLITRATYSLSYDQSTVILIDWHNAQLSEYKDRSGYLVSPFLVE